MPRRRVSGVEMSVGVMALVAPEAAEPVAMVGIMQAVHGRPLFLVT
jgi:hypothetical protein